VKHSLKRHYCTAVIELGGFFVYDFFGENRRRKIPPTHLLNQMLVELGGFFVYDFFGENRRQKIPPTHLLNQMQEIINNY